MTKTLQSNKQSEVDAESVPSSLRIVCDDASSINLQAAEAAEEGKPALRKFSMVAYTGGAKFTLLYLPHRFLVTAVGNSIYDRQE